MADLCEEIGDMPDYVVKDCGGDQGGIVAVAFIEPAVDFEIGTSPEQIEIAATWTALIGSPKQIHIITETRGEAPKAAVTEGEGFGRNKTVVTGRDHELTFEFLGIKENQELMKKLNRRKDLRFAYVTNGGLLHYVDTAVSIDAGPVIDRDINSWEYYAVTVKWDDFDFPQIFDEPEGIFE